MTQRRRRHAWSTVATLPLVPAVVDAVAPVPVIAAGGIGDARGVAAVLALGAQAAWLGTRFPCPCGSGRKFKRCHGDPGMRPNA